ncbi:MAG: DnaJ domain-containing protein [Polyangiaceae bacterium]
MVRGETIDDGGSDGKLTLVSGVDVRDLPIGPTEAFVLSRIDGHGTISDLALVSGLALEEVQGIVSRLVALGAVQVVDRRSLLVTSPPTMRSGEHAIPLAVQNQEEVGLSLEQQQVLLDLDSRLGSMNHYALLGVEPAADLKSIRAAYYEQVRVFHPDRHFGKPLGRFQAPLSRVFGKCTEAYDVLRRADTRAEYDQYLAARERTLALDRYFHEATSEPPVGSSSVPPASGARESRQPSDATSLRVSSVPPSDPEARRRALARKLGHSSVPPRSSSPSVPALSAPALAADELKRRYEQRLTQAREGQKNHYLGLAKEAEERRDLLAAANALRVAASLAPDDLELAGDLLELERRAAAELWEAYLERAKYAAVEGRPAEAAEAYERAALGHPSPALFERAAFFLLESGADPRRAAKLAKQAVVLAPNSAKCRLTLAQVYLAADLRESALAELERARVLEPDQPIIKDWIARAKRSGS